MAFRVEIARNAETELEELYSWVVERAPQQGAAWFNGLERACQPWGDLLHTVTTGETAFDHIRIADEA